MGDSKKASAGQYTHWARPKWIRMYTYNYEFGESYYRPQVRYASNSRYSSDVSSSSAYSSSYSLADSRSSFAARRRAVSPPKAMSFIERWSADPFYGRGFRSSSRAESSLRESSAYRGESSQRESSAYRGESMQRESSQYRSTRAESTERSTTVRASSELRSRRAQSEYSRSLAENSNYASDSLLQQINNVRATSIALQEESAGVQDRLRQRRARSLEVLRRAELDAQQYALVGASDDCLVRSDALDSVRRSRREQSVLSDIEARYSREGSVASNASGLASDYDYPRHHLVCNENCPFFTDPVHHRRFVIGNKFTDAAALGGFDVLYDPTVYKKTRTLLSRLSEERDVESSVYESTRESSMERGRSRSRYAYNTIY